MEYGLIGYPLGHSFSVPIHRRIAELSGRPYDYELRELPPEELGAFLTRRDFRGLNVTIPYKQAVIPYLDRLDPRAEAIGAVNTIVNREGALWGYNTDFDGLRALVAKMGLDLAGKKVLVLGTGGTSRTARAVAASLGAGEIVAVSRSGREGAVTYEEALRRHSLAEVIVNTTPCGMFPDLDAMPLDPARFPCLEGVVDAIFNPLSSRLVSAAEEKGVPAEGGLYMLVAQAVHAAGRFLGIPWSDKMANDIYRGLLSEKENLVLIGMPGSGKSTVGRELAGYLNKEFVDLDDWVVAHEGRPITDIFAEKGEGYFRDLESKGVRAVAPKNGLVIATGGGCVLRKENVRLLKMNGVTIFLDRTPEQLLPTDDRPLANTRERIERLYRERRALYAAAADITIDYYAPAELPRPLARVAELIAIILRARYGGNTKY